MDEKPKKIKVSSIKSNPNNPRVIKDEKFETLMKSISDFPKMMELRPIIIDEANIVLGGNMRLKALKQLGYKEIPSEWVKKASDLNEDEKKQFIVKDNVGFGEWDFEDLSKNWDSEKLIEWGLDIPDFGGDAKAIQDQQNIYTAKIKTPIYEPSLEKPNIELLCDKSKVNELIKKIQSSEISDEEKFFLTMAAQRHIVFDYAKIADFYAHSDKKVQELMEDSALVIIDFNKAIELGYVKLSEDIANQYLADHEDEA